MSSLIPFFGSGTTGAVAKKLNRHWIGIERDAQYIQVATERINAISSDLCGDDFIFDGKKKDEPRVPFGNLVENGWLQIGQTLFFEGQDELTAIILANGHIRHKDLEGSIHQMGKAIQSAPCNGWEHWHYKDETGALVVIDALRQKFRAEALNGP